VEETFFHVEKTLFSKKFNLLPKKMPRSANAAHFLTQNLNRSAPCARSQRSQKIQQPKAATGHVRSAPTRTPPAPGSVLSALFRRLQTPPMP